MLGKVIGEVWATKKHERLSGAKMLLVAGLEQSDGRLLPTGEVVVARDRMGADTGHLVVVTWGSGARKVFGLENDSSILCEAAICRIVDGYTDLEQLFDTQGGV